MSGTSRRVRLVVAGLLMMVAFVVTPALWARGSQRERAIQWAEHHRSSLPTTVEQLALFPPEYQDAAVNAMSIGARAGLWKDYLLKTAHRHPSLTERQRSLLREFAETITPADFAPDGAPNPSTLALLAEAQAALGRHAAIVGKTPWRDAAIARDLRRDSFWMTLAAARVRVDEYLGAAGAVSARMANTSSSCDCYVAAEGIYDCPGPEVWRKYCAPDVANGAICQVSTSGCDLFLNHPCNGACGYAGGGGSGGGGGGGGRCDGTYEFTNYCSPEYSCCEEPR
jgi:hypothetical protein